MGRPTKYTEEIANEIIGGIAVGMSDKDAALAAGIHEDTLLNWRKRYSDFSARLMRARKQRSRLLLRRIHTASERDWRAAAELLDRTDREYRKTPLEITGKDGGPIQHETTVTIRDLATRAAEDEGIDPDLVVAEAERWLAETRM